MEQYIPKSPIVAEIEREIEFGKLKIQQSQENNDYTSNVAWSEHIASYGKMLSFLNTLEVKEENNLENLFQALPEKIADEKSHQVYELSIYHYDGQCVVDYVVEIDHDSLYVFSGNTLYEAIEKAWIWLKENAKGG